jgi:hypothetical protein
MVVATIVGCCAFAGLVPLHSPKLGLAYLKLKHAELFRIDTRLRAREWVVAEACWGDSARVQAAAVMVIERAVHACGQRCSGAWWLELMVDVDCGGQSR